jgi:hypothetical protein
MPDHPSGGHFPCVEIQEEENVVGDEATPGQHFHCKEIDAGQERQMKPDEVRPPDFLSPLGTGAIPNRRRMLPAV